MLHLKDAPESVEAQNSDPVKLISLPLLKKGPANQPSGVGAFFQSDALEPSVVGSRIHTAAEVAPVMTLPGREEL